MSDAIDLSDNPVRALRALLQERGMEIDQAFTERLDKLEAYCDEPAKCCNGGPQWGHAWDCPELP